MIDFKAFSAADKEIYEKYLFSQPERGCEYSFANLFMWGEQSVSYSEGRVLIFSVYGKHKMYPFPIGDGDIKTAIEKIIADSKERKIPCVITGMTPADKAELEKHFPNMFDCTPDRDFFDYVYLTESLAELRGRKYHGKKNHFNKFCAAHPSYEVKKIDETNIDDVRNMLDVWYEERAKTMPESDFGNEKRALAKALDNFAMLDMTGIMISEYGKVLAVTMGSRLSKNTYDVHFEKALFGEDGTYAAINREFARMIAENYPDIEYLNREDDMGLEGLRKAKESYRPHHMVEKWQAVLHK